MTATDASTALVDLPEGVAPRRGLAVASVAAGAGALAAGVVAIAWRSWPTALAAIPLAAVAGAAGRASSGVTVAALIDAPSPGSRVGPALRPVLFVNPRSGDGKAEAHDLEAECLARGIEVVELKEGDDLAALARDAVERGADVLGMAGGDGSQAIVAQIAADAGLAYVCVPAGTRNHLALDLGLDRDDPVAALDAFGPAAERRIDLAVVNGRVFVNNVSLGAYAEIVQSDEYRDAKFATTIGMLPEIVGPDAEPFDLRHTGPDDTERAGASLIQVSNGAYELSGVRSFGSRGSLADGVLGIITLTVDTTTDLPALAARVLAGRAEDFPGLEAWTATRLEVDSSGPVAAGIDGEATELDPPLRFRSRPHALRVRVPDDAPGHNPAEIAALRRDHGLRAVVRLALTGR